MQAIAATARWNWESVQQPTIALQCTWCRLDSSCSTSRAPLPGLGAPDEEVREARHDWPGRDFRVELCEPTAGLTSRNRARFGRHLGAAAKARDVEPTPLLLDRRERPNA